MIYNKKGGEEGVDNISSTSEFGSFKAVEFLTHLELGDGLGALPNTKLEPNGLSRKQNVSPKSPST